MDPAQHCQRCPVQESCSSPNACPVCWPHRTPAPHSQCVNHHHVCSLHCRKCVRVLQVQLKVCKHTLHGGSLSVGSYMPCGGYFHARHRCPGSEQTWWRSALSCPHRPPVLHEPEPCCAAASSCSGEHACLGYAAITRRSGCMQLCHRSPMCSRNASCAQR